MEEKLNRLFKIVVITLIVLVISGVAYFIGQEIGYSNGDASGYQRGLRVGSEGLSSCNSILEQSEEKGQVYGWNSCLSQCGCSNYCNFRSIYE